MPTSNSARPLTTRSSLPPPVRPLRSPERLRDESSYRRSAAFPFSTARPPTDYTTASWVAPAPSPVRPFHTRGRENGAVPLSVRATDSWIPFTAARPTHRRASSSLSARSDTGLLRSAGIRETILPGGETPKGGSWLENVPRSATAYSASSWHGPRTGVTPFEPVEEDWESTFAPEVASSKEKMATLAREAREITDPNGTVGTDPSTLHRLGPMTPVTPRYSFQPLGYSKRQSLRRSQQGEETALARPAVNSKLIATYLTVSPFSRALLGLIGAVLLTCVVKSLDSGMAGIVKVSGGVFPISAAGNADVQLGVSGWCATGRCREYLEQDFASVAATLKIPGSKSLSTLGILISAHLSMIWLQAAFNLITAFLHFFLLSTLLLPIAYLPNLPASERIEAEIELQVRCYQPPNEGMGWVWWAWWAHQRGPVGPIFGLVNGVLACATFALVLGFLGDVKAVAKDGGVGLGTGAFVIVIVFMLNLDFFISSVLYWVYAPGRNLALFHNPPSPTPAALFLPHTGPNGAAKPLVEDRGSFFPVRRTQAFALNTPGAIGLDPETRRWLAAYPADPELVPLISSLRAGHVSDDFLLSDIGLLYVRAESSGLGAQALLVPPRGEIRRELVQDAHFDSENDEHVLPERMSRTLADTFWWPGIDEDVEEFVSRCRSCVERRVWEAQVAGGRRPSRTAAASQRAHTRDNVPIAATAQ